jgi:DNA-binding transcriptional MerR regulator
MANIGIGTLAELTGVKIPTIRFYEQNNLVPPPRRTEGGQRRYGESAIRRLHFIRHARDLGFSVQDIRELLASNIPPCRATLPNRSRSSLATGRGKDRPA